MDTVFIVGCGDIGARLSGLWVARGAKVLALARSDASARRLSRLGVTPVRGDLDDPASLDGLPARGSFLYYLAPPPDAGETDPRVRALLSALPPGEEPGKAIYMSTTAVYGDNGGAWVTEETPPAPASTRGKRRLDAEGAFLAWGRERRVPVVILRVSGIYGPGRLPVDAVRRGAPVVREDEAPWTNRIHADDLAAVCVAAAERGGDGAVYNVSDGAPGTITGYYNAVADLLRIARPPTVTMADARKVMSPGMLSYLSESRRLDVRRMREGLAVTLRYPDLAAGLPSCLPEEER
ncbi:MAG TPA: NAD(P)-dependent oxidoreductase [Deltaproteobacteria bacterium]|nr:MAG: NAD(P)-dependent oxidoreductase [Deltaproteobacteria bacterium GWA2_65_63]OGP27586.1 MAG: NAD(P)-dependent oxidoreductase [Deltaproteobacteria bacterium GWB2_65_81]OGP39622.1 MAG: NAD(P)-dependent oxidoreductase [Deltaproteobacteria bacterium GWC2_66_88]OGP78782.1 MAG: NAD(P)-dependent oxidoreductase [Deltaproteobacteria bacterium RBG_16_66_15]HAM33616.1 NAD(P)-dependent oxidoreductase [Deltaproteobacteria bacterium]